MNKKATINPKIKLALAIAVPVLVMIVTVCTVGMSFAWFSDEVEISITTINLSTTEVYTIALDVIAPEGELSPYHGETAMKYTAQSSSVATQNLYIISPYRAKQLGYTLDETDPSYRAYIQDAPFKFVTSFKLTSTDVPVDLTMTIDTVQIKNQDGEVVTNPDDSTSFIPIGDPYVMDTYGVEVLDGSQTQQYNMHSVDEIPYVYTWYFTKGNDTSTLYTPYGTMVMADENGVQYAQKVGGGDFESISAKEPTDVTNFVADEDATYNFYIVFAPEKLFWMQYVKADRDLTANQVYTQAQLDYIVTQSQPYQMYYAGYNYLGANFHFTASIRVSNVYWPEEGGNA